VLRGRAITCDPIDGIDVIRNGKVVATIEGKGHSDMALEWRDDDALAGLLPERELANERFCYYYLRLRTLNGGLGWTSPVWVHG
jgi:hypothetical protein